MCVLGIQVEVHTHLQWELLFPERSPWAQLFYLLVTQLSCSSFLCDLMYGKSLWIAVLHRLTAKYDMYSDLFILKEQIYHDQVHKTKFMISAFESAQLSVINYIFIAAPWSPLPASKPFITPDRYFVAIRNTSPSTHFSSSFYLSNVQDWPVLRLPCKQS